MKMTNFDKKSSIRRITFAWGLGFPLCYLIGWSIGYTLIPNSAIGSDWGSIVGLSIGAGLSGLFTALEIQGRIKKNRLFSLVLVAFGWAIGFLLIGYFWLEIASIIDSPI